MKTANIREIKEELSNLASDKLIEICLKMAKFKKENKELLTYLLFESHDESGYIASVKSEIDTLFETINTDSYHYIKKSVRKILRTLKKYARYSSKKETEVELLLYFCQRLKDFEPSIQDNVTLMNIYHRQIVSIKKIVSTLHEDLQYDYHLALEELT